MALLDDLVMSVSVFDAKLHSRTVLPDEIDEDPVEYRGAEMSVDEMQAWIGLLNSGQAKQAGREEMAKSYLRQAHENKSLRNRIADLEAQHTEQAATIAVLQTERKRWLDRAAELEESGKVTLWTCEGCAFTVDAVHRNTDGSTTCPACREVHLEEDLRRKREECANLETGLADVRQSLTWEQEAHSATAECSAAKDRELACLRRELRGKR